MSVTIRINIILKRTKISTFSFKIKIFETNEKWRTFRSSQNLSVSFCSKCSQANNELVGTCAILRMYLVTFISLGLLSKQSDAVLPHVTLT